MTKIGIIGLGDIAEKAYLPVLSRKKVEVHLCSRNETRLQHLAEQYRFTNRHSSLESLVGSGITGAFVHTATSSHFEIVEYLLNHNIHVYVDKPVTYDFASTQKLLNLAEAKGLLLEVGFNRRFAPAYQNLKGMKDINMVIMQKNRKSLPGETRVFVFDDFIHVIDTLLYLFPYPVKKIHVNGKKKEGLLVQVTVQMISEKGDTAIGIMNRDSGTIEEKVEVFSGKEKRIAYNLSEVVIYQDQEEKKLKNNDWQPMLYTRGFEQMVDAFLEKVQIKESSVAHRLSALRTHEICEEIVLQLSAVQSA